MGAITTQNKQIMSAPRTAWAPYKCPFQTCTWKLLLPVPTRVKWEFAHCTGDMVIPEVMLEHLQHCWGPPCHLCGYCWFLKILKVRPGLLLPVDDGKALVCILTKSWYQGRKGSRTEAGSWLRHSILTGGTYRACLAKEGFEGGWKSFYLVNFLHTLSKAVTENGPEQCVVAYCASCNLHKALSHHVLCFPSMLHNMVGTILTVDVYPKSSHWFDYFPWDVCSEWLIQHFFFLLKNLLNVSERDSFPWMSNHLNFVLQVV